MGNGEKFGIEYHCHNVDSNGKLGPSRTINDSPQTYEEMLDSALNKGLGAIIVTNHNEHKIDGLLEYKNNHPQKYGGIEVYPGVEISCSYNRKSDGKEMSSAHLLGLGIDDGIYKIGMNPAEAAEKIKAAGGTVVAPHPRGMTSSLYKEGLEATIKNVDVIEAFNSNNVDVYSNTGAFYDAVIMRKPAIAGSDAHTKSGMGRCVTEMYGENKLDNILTNMEKGDFEVTKMDYTTIREISELYNYQLSEPRLMLDSMKKKYGKWGNRAGNIAYKGADSLRKSAMALTTPNPETARSKALRYLGRAVVKTAGDTLLARMRNISKKLNVYDYDMELLDVPTARKIVESCKPVDRDKVGHGFVDLRLFEDKRNPQVSIKMINDHNMQLRGVNPKKDLSETPNLVKEKEDA